MIVREATPVDARGIAEVHVRGWQIGLVDYFSSEYLRGQDWFLEEDGLERRREDLASTTDTTLIAEEDQRILGFATYLKNRDHLAEDIGELAAIYVDPDYWNRGVGTALMDNALQGMAEAGYRSAILWTLGANIRTRRFYENRGWQIDGTTKSHRTGVELVRYSRSLLP